MEPTAVVSHVGFEKIRQQANVLAGRAMVLANAGATAVIVAVAVL